MENFIDYLSLVLGISAIMGLIIGSWVFIGEKLIEKFNLKDKFLKFMFDYDNN